MLVRSLRTAIVAVVVVIGMWMPRVAWACPVCFAAKNEESRVAFVLTTGFLTALPLLVLGSLIYWVYRRSQALESEEQTGCDSGRGSGELAKVTPLRPASHQPVDR